MFSYSRFVHHDADSLYRHVEPLSTDYTVTVNGEDVPVYTCRISRYPFNRVWTGIQRSPDQSELASFVNLVSDEPLTLTVTAHRPHETVLLKPYSKGITPVEADGKITFTLPEAGQFVLETDSYHHCLYIFNSRPIPSPEPTSVTHYFGPGVHMAGKITLHDHDRVYVDKDALVFGCLYADHADHIHIFGNGLLDDSGEGRINGHCYENYTNGNLKFYDCNHLRIEGVLCRDSAIWCLNLFHCTDVVVDGIKIFGQWRYNTDGVDIVNCRDVVIRNSFVHSFDDTITIKGIDRYAHTDNENILTENCVLWCDWGKTCEIGLETACRACRRITFRNCDLLRAGNTALDIQNGDCAEVSDVLFEDIRVEYNHFDTAPQYQDSDDTVYTGLDSIQIPALLSITNDRFHTAACEALWGIPADWSYNIDLTGVRFATAHDITCRRIRVYYDPKIPLRNGVYQVPIVIRSGVPGARHEHIHLWDVSVNGTPLTLENAILDISGVDDFRIDGQAAIDGSASVS